MVGGEFGVADASHTVHHGGDMRILLVFGDVGVDLIGGDGAFSLGNGYRGHDPPRS